MLNYWDADPEQRPTFAQLVTTMTSVLDLLADYLDVTTFITGDLSGARGFNQLSVLLSLFHSSLIPSSAPSFITTCSAWLSLFCCPSWLYSHISTLHHLRLWDSLFCLLLIVLGIYSTFSYQHCYMYLSTLNCWYFSNMVYLGIYIS